MRLQLQAHHPGGAKARETGAFAVDWDIWRVHWTRPLCCVAWCFVWFYVVSAVLLLFLSTDHGPLTRTQTHTVMHMHMFTRAGTHTCMLTCMCMCACTYLHTHTHTHSCMRYTCLHIHAHIFLSVSLSLFPCLRLSVCLSPYICIHADSWSINMHARVNNWAHACPPSSVFMLEACASQN